MLNWCLGCIRACGCINTAVPEQGPVLEIVSQSHWCPPGHSAGCGVGRREVCMFGVSFSPRASSKPCSVDGECCWMPADKAKWLKTLPLFGSLSPNPNENTEGSRGQRRGRTHTLAWWGPGWATLSRGTWWGSESGDLKALGQNPRSQGLTMGPTPKEREPAGAAAALLQVPRIWDSSRVCFFF